MNFPGHGYFVRYRILLAIGFFFLFLISYFIVKVFIYPPSENNISYSDNNLEVLGLNIPPDLNFCGEKLPKNDYGIKRALEKEFFSNSYWKSNSVIFFNKAQRWFPVIEPILKQEGIPQDFKYLAVIESHLSNATSPAGAAGFWQLVPFSARNYGLEVNEYVDERYHVEKSTRAACHHIKEAYQVFKNWTLAAAAYNRGIGGIQNALANQKTDNYFDLLLNPETGSFVYRILAYKTLLGNPSHFGIRKKLHYAARPAYNVLPVDTTIRDLAAFARHKGISFITLRAFNPWLRKNTLPNPAGQTYEIRIPKNTEADYSGYAVDMLPEGDPIATYVMKPERADSVNQDTILTKQIKFTVRMDEPLGSLAKFLKVSEEDIRRWNNLKEGENAVKGQTLVIYYRN